MSYITAIGTANPPHKIEQSAAATFMVNAMGLAGDDERRLRALYKMTGIETRHSVISDYNKVSDFSFYSNTANLEPFPSTRQRMELFRQHAARLSVEAARDCLQKREDVQLNEITHLIVVSCTGMYAPGLDIDIVKQLGLSSTVMRTAINFMGCYASFNALKIGDSIVESDPSAKVLVVSTELCTIHFQKEKTDDNYLSNALFADGSAAVLIESIPRKGSNLKPTSFFCDLATEGAQDMAWSVGDVGFEMRLSSYVPEIIRSGIAKLTQSLLTQINDTFSNIDYFAIHPGGRKILEVIEQELAISRDQNRHAYNVLQRYGNMSSPTVLFVLNEVVKTLGSADQQKKILSFAFGPGLTMESMILEIHHR